ncbi:MAG TPA: aldehyde dehydrogenase family protein, partial [Solirubrobacterales bacterium]|nr:aldehyde dehydrogenase family protein [Solirubrobacterales bacterium]
MSEPGALLAGAAWQRGAYLDGAWRDGGGELVEVLEPATGKVLGSFEAASAELVAEACARAGAAQPGWLAAGAERRSELLLRAAGELEAAGEEIAAWL